MNPEATVEEKRDRINEERLTDITVQCSNTKRGYAVLHKRET